MTFFANVNAAGRGLVIFAALGLLACVGAPGTASAQDDGYGYYEVVGAAALNIRERPYESSRVLTVAERGEILVKWRRYCSLRPWCPVEKDGVRGWAGRAYLRETD